MTAAAGYVRVEGGKLYFERAGEGFPVVLIHAGLWDSRMWDDQFEVFAEQHDVVRYDVRGFGRSDVPSAPYSDLRDLRYLLGELDISRCAIVGCSMGGQLAIDFALAHPDVVDAVVPVAPGLSGYRWEDPGLEMLVAEVEKAITAGDLELAMEIELAVWAPARDDPATDIRIRSIAMDNLHIFRVPDTFAEIPAPAVPRLGEIQAAMLVLVGDQDVAEIHAIAELLEHRVPGAHRHVIAGGDHLVNVRRPEKFNRQVLDFLSFRM
jgi:pimeloyl-ACP methyl ester carboxylesterase